LGRKVHPLGFRLGIVQDWQAKWYADTNYAEVLQEDLTIRRAIQTKYPDAAISRVEIDRQAKEVTVTIHTARPGIVIGRGGQRVDEFNSYLEKTTGKKVRLNIQEIRQAELDAFLVARTIADQIQRRISYRRAMKQAIFRTMQAGAKGIRINCSGRLGDSEIARRQTMHEGQVPLHTIRADIDYAFTEARTTLGRIGVKVWIYKGEILPELRETEVEEPAAPGEELAEVSPEAPAPETPAEPETAPATPARTRRRAAATAEEKPAEEPPEVAEATAEKPTEAPAEAAEATAEKATDIPAEKSAPKRRKKVTPEAEEKTQEAVAEEGAKAETEAKAEDKPARTARKRSKQAEASTETPEAEASSIADQEDKDAAT
jgi:small subunit ribosomal protein S3